jgi:hypothetical protein
MKSRGNPMSKKNKKQNASNRKNDMMVTGMLLAAIALGGVNLIFYGVNVFSLGMTIVAVILLVRRML